MASALGGCLSSKSHLVQATAFVLSCVEAAKMLVSQDWQILLMGQHQHYGTDHPSIFSLYYYFSLPKMVRIFHTVQPFSLSLPLHVKQTPQVLPSLFIQFPIMLLIQCGFQFSFWNFSSFHHITFFFHSVCFL